jgi:hypothetical protein
MELRSDSGNTWIADKCSPTGPIEKGCEIRAEKARALVGHWSARHRVPGTGYFDLLVFCREQQVSVTCLPYGPHHRLAPPDKKNLPTVIVIRPPSLTILTEDISEQKFTFTLTFTFTPTTPCPYDGCPPIGRVGLSMLEDPSGFGSLLFPSPEVCRRKTSGPITGSGASPNRPHQTHPTLRTDVWGR